MKIRKKYPLSNIIFILSLSLICIFYFVYLQRLVPPKFTWDGSTIMRGIDNPTSVSVSYRNVSLFFKFLGITSSTNKGVDVHIHFLAWIIFQLFLITILRINKNKLFSITQIFFVLFFTFMYGIYFDTLSKDLILILLVLIFLYLYIFNNKFIYLFTFIGIYAYFFREYWFILLIFLALIFIMGNVKLNKKIICYCIFFFIIFIFIYDLFNDNFITNYRTYVNNIRIGSINARSMINNILPNINIFDDIINYFYVLITLIVPIQGIKSINVIIYYFWIISLLIFIIKDKKKLNVKLLLFLFAYINMQALFEPDIGSTFRHQLALFPLIYYLLNDIKVRDKKY